MNASQKKWQSVDDDNPLQIQIAKPPPGNPSTHQFGKLPSTEASDIWKPSRSIKHGPFHIHPYMVCISATREISADEKKQLHWLSLVIQTHA